MTIDCVSPLLGRLRLGEMGRPFREVAGRRVAVEQCQGRRRSRPGSCGNGRSAPVPDTSRRRARRCCSSTSIQRMRASLLLEPRVLAAAAICASARLALLFQQQREVDEGLVVIRVQIERLAVTRRGLATGCRWRRAPGPAGETPPPMVRTAADDSSQHVAASTKCPWSASRVASSSATSGSAAASDLRRGGSRPAAGTARATRGL